MLPVSQRTVRAAVHVQPITQGRPANLRTPEPGGQALHHLLETLVSSRPDARPAKRLSYRPAIAGSTRTSKVRRLLWGVNQNRRVHEPFALVSVALLHSRKEQCLGAPEGVALAAARKVERSLEGMCQHRMESG